MITDTIQRQLTAAMKAGEKEKIVALRTLSACLYNAKIAKKAELSDEEAVRVLKQELKKREEARTIYEQAGRIKQAGGEAFEARLIKQFLPHQLSEAELKQIIDVIVGDEKDSKQFGGLMKRIIAEVSGRADGSLIAKLLKEKLS